MYIPDHKPALLMAASSIVSAATHAATTSVAVPAMFDVVERWVLLVGHIAAALAGFASFVWYAYSFIKARRGK